jgi:hypothetical protein
MLEYSLGPFGGATGVGLVHHLTRRSQILDYREFHEMAKTGLMFGR